VDNCLNNSPAGRQHWLLRRCLKNRRLQWKGVAGGGQGTAVSASQGSLGEFGAKAAACAESKQDILVAHEILHFNDVKPLTTVAAGVVFKGYA
jgi:hypothetical protein